MACLHPLLRGKDAEFQQLARSLKPSIRDEISAKLAMLKLLSSVRDSHTTIDFRQLGIDTVPVELDWVEGQLVVVTRGPLFGATVEGIDGHAPSEVLAAVKPYLAYENEVRARILALDALRAPAFLHSLGLAVSVERLTLAVRPYGNARTEQVTFKAASNKTEQQVSVLPGAEWQMIPERGIYVTLRRPVPKAEFEAMLREIKSMIYEQRPPVSMVVDFRQNTGGDQVGFEPFVSLLDAAKRDGRLHWIGILVGPKTFSSGIDESVMLAEKLSAPILGTETGGKRKYCGFPETFKLRNSRIEVIYPTYCDSESDRRSDPPSVKPDVEISPTVEDLVSMRDVALERCWELSRRSSGPSLTKQ